MLRTGIIFLLPFMLASVSLTQGHTIPNFFPPSNGNNDRDPPTPSDFPDLLPPGRDEWSLFEHRGGQPKPKEGKDIAKAASFLSKLPAITELLYDVEVIACSAATPPSPGRMVLYETWVHENNQGAIRCWSRQVSAGSILAAPGDYGTIYTIRSENFGMSSYHPRRLQYFKIKCPSDGEITSMTTDLEAQASLTLANQTLGLCVDYVHVMYEDSESSCHLCGSQTVESKSCEQDFEGGILVTFRTSNLHSHFKGFEMNVICYEASEQNLPGCIETLPAEEGEAMNSNEDSHYYYRAAKKKFLPASAKAQLMTFYKNNINTARAFSAEGNYEMLRLALLSQNSCNAVLRALGRGVSQMFPPHMVLQAKINGWEYK